MVTMMTVNEVSRTTGMSEYAIRQGVRSGMYPSIRIGGNPNGKILINIQEFVSTLNNIARTNMVGGEVQSDVHHNGGIRRIAQ